MACHLIKTLYGLKQAPRAWLERLHRELDSLGFKPSEADPSLFIQTNKNSNTYLLTYVDDILIAAPDTATVQQIKDSLMTAFDARDLGETNHYLGINIIRDRGSGTIKLSQELMITKMIEQYGQTDARTLTTPLSPSIKLSAGEGDPLDTATYPYSQLVGKLMYLMVCTRPDIAYAVGALARYMSKPLMTHWQAAKGVVRYLAGTSKHGLTFGTSKDTLVGYCDADYAGDVDTRRSTTGYVFMMTGRRSHVAEQAAADSCCIHHRGRVHGSSFSCQGGPLATQASGRPEHSGWQHQHSGRQPERHQAAAQPHLIPALQAHRCDPPLCARARHAPRGHLHLREYRGSARRYHDQGPASTQAQRMQQRHGSRPRLRRPWEPGGSEG
eukprot:GHRQ01022471.1.p1 GENE.GHRQ01022471.1~~GHRQ01022471.1.p1  ORF type:complete len:384 (+),score=60.15 GHRQ01022471.1:381-1532(+)